MLALQSELVKWVNFTHAELNMLIIDCVCCVLQCQFQFLCEAILRVYKEKKARSTPP